MSAGFNILAAFGQDGIAQFIEYSKATDGYESEKDVRDKWNDLSKRSPTCKAAAFWAYARAGGYQGGLPDDVKLNGSDVGREILTDVVENVDLFRDQGWHSLRRDLAAPRGSHRLDGVRRLAAPQSL